MTIRKNKLALLVGLLCAGSAAAQDVYTFDEVVVSATRSEQNISDVAASVDVVSSEKLEKDLSQNMKSAVESEPGVSMAGNGRFGLTGFNIRGRDENYVKTIIDGVELPGTYNPGADVMRKYNNTLETDTLQRIEINKGPISSLYGSDALAGAVILRTKNPDDLLDEGNDTYASVKGGYYSADESYKATATLANRTGDLETLLIFTHRDGHETQTYGGSGIAGPDRGEADPVDFQSDNILAKAFYQLNDAHRVGVSVESYHRDQDVIRLSDEGDVIAFGPYRYVYSNTRGYDDDSRQRYSIEHQWQANNPAFDLLEWRVAYLKSESKHDNTDTLTKTTPTGTSVENRNRQRIGEDESWQADVQFNKVVALDSTYHDVVYGASYVSNEFNLDYNNINRDTGMVTDATPEVPNAESRKWGVFIQDQMFLMNETLVLNAGLRYDNFSAAPKGNSAYADGKNDALTGRLGAVYHWNDTFSTFAQVSQGFKAPTLQDLYYFYDTGATFIPNPNLKAEESISYETGMRFRQEFGRIDIAVFYNDYKNFIESRLVDANGPDGKEVWTTDNIGRAEIYGAELKAHLALDRMLGAPTGIYSDLSLAYAKGENKTNGEAIDTVAPLTATLALGYVDSEDTYGGKVSMRAVAGKSGDDWSNANNVNNVSAPGYTVTDLTAYYRPMKDLTLRAGLFNVFDKKYWDYADLAGVDKDESGLDRRTQPGRNWGIEAEYVF
ncbi:TonB-dependent hemoglobin/transferrin/lactoferrin family receptor [Grimontia hollisae]|uniref:TonB-dependent heme and hemoglobin receptor HutA n=1 Tax=Grimontia hollisae CIP 101886 TaxID=675812 RepID=D0I5H9_GRIHO|nr:TonB-dependent hemoglobin/transferrin/lactoferrin family receptor [Grimontia hollisae]AMG29243.1 TonB-dependent hemoglobin/transferrin/lactoferrin family receptor [Grimontia hollisae]EEY73143.1 TonB-dependent heme and hemoglobin receptor HutA [Grimontia hollisae CIP 101886]STO76601.1 Probable hemoglobin and hemoglobin-haptoglobin-binding protein 2 precursor [Grimontia hollisae]